MRKPLPWGQKESGAERTKQAANSEAERKTFIGGSQRVIQAASTLHFISSKGCLWEGVGGGVGGGGGGVWVKPARMLHIGKKGRRGGFRGELREVT